MPARHGGRRSGNASRPCLLARSAEAGIAFDDPAPRPSLHCPPVCRDVSMPDPTRPDPTRPDPTRPDPIRPDPVRLAHRVAELVGCTRDEAEQYIRNGWVMVD